MCGTFCGCFQHICLCNDTILFMSLTSLKRFDVLLVPENLGQPLAFCTKERGFGFVFCVLDVLLCLGSWCAERATQGPSAGTGFPFFETPLQADTRAPSSLSDAAVALIIDLFVCVGGLCHEPALWPVLNAPHSHRAQSCWLWGAPALSWWHREEPGIWLLPVCLEGVSYYCCSKFPLALNLAHFMTIFQRCSQ